LVKALTGIREANHRASDNRQRFVLTARDLLVLGKLINAWKDIVGLQLAAKTCPTRLIKGKLYLAVADSQWLQTLVFLKARIIEKLNELFPEMKISEIIGKPGIIPPEVEKIVKEASWPEWQSEKIVPMAELKDPELAEQLRRCQQKLDARLKGLEERGYKLCVLCRAAVTRSDNGVCAMCVYKSREDKLLQTRVLISEMPWLTFEEVSEFDGGLGKIEFEAIRNQLLDDSLALIRELAVDLALVYDEECHVRMKKEMVRAMMLFSGCMPDKVDFDYLHTCELPDPEWLHFLAIKPGEPEC
ncbi:MAG: DciA family protein, partial [Candidatus Riflebacteria bacterium]|nr:DciA family protein [Candidatus Riflebacteria bacterium]